jgi:hypothetical protein
VRSAAPPAPTDGDADAADDALAAALEIDVRGRWDALDLSELLIPYHSFLVQHTSDSWVVHARAPGHRGEPFTGALSAIQEWVAERRRGGVTVRVDGRPYGASR